MNTKKSIVILLIMISFAISCTNSNDSSGISSFPTSSRLEEKLESPKIKVGGLIIMNHYGGENLKEFALSQPLPEIWLYLPNNNETDSSYLKIELPEEAKKTLYQHWVKMLNHYYLTEIEEMKNVNYQNEDVLLVQSTIDTKKKLLATQFNVGSKSRYFSSDEVSELVIYIRDASGEVIKKIKEIKKQQNNTL